MNKKNFIILLVLIFFTCLLYSGENKYSWDFEDCNIKDILMALSMDSGISICADDTVTGKGDFKFSGNDFDSAFEAFLLANRLFVEKSDSSWFVSKFHYSKENELINLDVYDLNAVEILEKLSEKIETIITFDLFPQQKLSLHFRNVSRDSLLEALCRRFGNCELLQEESKVHFARVNERRNLQVEEGYALFNIENNKIQLDIKNFSFAEVLEKFFEKWNEQEIIEYCFVGKIDGKISRSFFAESSFSNALKKICKQNGYDFINSDGIFYIHKNENNSDDILNYSWEKYEVKKSKRDTVCTVINKLGLCNEIITLPLENEFLIKTGFENHKKIKEILETLDKKENVYSFELQNISPDNFLERLPPDFPKEKFKTSGEDNLVYFTGSLEEFEYIKSQLENFDKPIQRIRYDLLILQYDETSKNSWLSSFNSSRLTLGDRNNLGLQLGSVTSFNLNVISSFGLSFASKLQSSLEENITTVFADTVLYGVSGKTISFENSSIYRYRDNNLDPETGKPIYSGVTREINSGIKLEIKARVSGNGKITSSVIAKISRQGIDNSPVTGNPPPTTEKIINTEVCGKSGEPIILSGLLQNSNSTEVSGTPGISKVPYLGKLFKNESKIKEHSQMVIYLVPHLEGEEIKKSVIVYDQNWYEKKLEELKEVEKNYESGI